jgi:hypothetical protein
VVGGGAVLVEAADCMLLIFLPGVLARERRLGNGRKLLLLLPAYMLWMGNDDCWMKSVVASL